MFYSILAQQKPFTHFISIYHAAVIERKKFFYSWHKNWFFYIFISTKRVFSFISFLIQHHSNCNTCNDIYSLREFLGFNWCHRTVKINFAIKLNRNQLVSSMYTMTLAHRHSSIDFSIIFYANFPNVRVVRRVGIFVLRGNFSRLFIWINNKFLEIVNLSTIFIEN